ncbi:unnamed protein product [Brassicogethes aeneus]|uniref:SWIM-type domain-containing protein n=1 Tax=Brassicogethes aeneus TaxID=1431903 RepID=A0A9P0B3B8_BRAAE|nr:unnamed protein product [Brassicogethes aeneus]
MKLPPPVVNYYNENWHKIKKEWTLNTYFLQNSFLNRTSNRLESLNQKLKSVIHKDSSLTDFIENFFTLYNGMTEERDHTAAYQYFKVPLTRFEKDTPQFHYSNYLTQYAFNFVQKELQEYTKIDTTSPNQSTRSHMATDISCTCSIFISMMLPCRHIFSIREAQFLPLYEESLCNKRWTKDHLRKHQKILTNCSVVDSATTDSVVITDLTNNSKMNRKLNKFEKYKKSMLIMRDICSLVAEKSGNQYEITIKALLKLKDFLLEDKLIDIVDIGQNTELTQNLFSNPVQVPPWENLEESNEPEILQVPPWENQEESDVPESHSVTICDNTEGNNPNANKLIIECDIDNECDDHNYYTNELFTKCADIDKKCDENKEQLYLFSNLVQVPPWENQEESDIPESHSVTICDNTEGNNPNANKLIIECDIDNECDEHNYYTNELITKCADIENKCDQNNKNTVNKINNNCDDEILNCKFTDQVTILENTIIPKVYKKRGRPKGSEMTVVGLPKKKKSSSGKQSFAKRPSSEKKLLILKWLIPRYYMEVFNKNRSIEADDINIDIPHSILDDNVNISIIEEFCTHSSWSKITSTLNEKSKLPWFCARCAKQLSPASIICENCLMWYHTGCVGLKKVPKKKIWFCKFCD